MRRLTLRIAALSVALCAVAVSPAHASFNSVFGDYQSDGSINACAHSPGELKGAGGAIPNDVAQYAPDFPSAVNGALAAHLRGDCAGAAGGASGVPGVPGVPGQALPQIGGKPVVEGRIVIKRPPAPPPSAVAAKRAPGVTANSLPPLTRDPGSKLSVPLPMVVLAAFGVLGLLSLLAWGIGRALGYDWAALAPVRHGFGELGMRFESALDRFRLKRS